MSNSKITTFFEIGFVIRQFLLDKFVQVSFKLYGFDNVDFDDIQQRKYKKTNQQIDIDVNLCWDIDPLHQVAKDAYFEEKVRRKLLTEKCHALHLYSMFCAAVLGAMFMSLKEKINLYFGISSGLCLFFLILTTLMLIVFYGRDAWAYVVVDKNMIGKQGDTLKNI
jgi:hypothetical protein